MKYLITGGAGFIGSNFVKYVLSSNENIEIVVVDSLTYAGNLQTIENELDKITFIKCSICDRDAIKNIFNEHEIDIVINFAAESHVDRSIENPQVFLETNILGTQVLLESAKSAWQVNTDEKGYPIYKEGKKFLHVSTDEVYGSLKTDYIDGKNFELDEALKNIVKNRTDNVIVYGDDFFRENTPISPRSPYSASKASSDMIVMAYGDTYKLPFNITRCSNNYGAYHFPEKLIPLTIKNIIEGRDIPVYGKGDNVRDWLFVEDHCKAIFLVAKNGLNGEVYNVGGLNEAKNIDIVKLIIKHLALFITKNEKYQKLIKHSRKIDESLIVFVKDRLGHDARYAIDPTKISTKLGWYPETTFEEGIKKTVLWNLDNQDWVEDVVSGDYTMFYDKYYNKR